jgi:hypothetical protein
MMIDGDPLWRRIAYWLVIVSFFSIPLVVLILHLMFVLQMKETYQIHRGEFQYIWTFHATLGAMLIAMLGLHSWDKRLNGKTVPPQTPQSPPPQISPSISKQPSKRSD